MPKGKQTVKTFQDDEGFWNRNDPNLAEVQNKIIEADRDEKGKRKTKRPQ